VLLVIVTARLVADDVHTFGAKSILPYNMSSRILITVFILHLFITQLMCQKL